MTVKSPRSTVDVLVLWLMNVRSAYTDTFTLAGFDGNFHGCTNGLVGGIAVSAKHS